MLQWPIAAYRADPGQLSGFSGHGMAAMDYLIADPFVAAGDLARTSSEKLVLLPDCFLPADGVAATLPAPPSRSLLRPRHRNRYPSSHAAAVGHRVSRCSERKKPWWPIRLAPESASRIGQIDRSVLPVKRSAMAATARGVPHTSSST